ncbi:MULTISPECIES: hypothetical protein [Pseudomonas]|uniref:hypothetical protein n=1 Tax=Pseudomonas TaxID=286 RepID=UPI00257A836E|nr:MULTISPECIES: hypothetical protein [Pseudomonas]
MHEKHTPLKNWPYFRLALAIPLFSAVVIAAFIKYSDTSIGQLCGSSACWTNFIAFFKVPIAIASLAIPIAGVVVAMHRSDETAIQIKNSQRQIDEALANNKFGNYLKHRDSFINLVLAGQERLLIKESRVKINASALYEKIYPKNSYTNLELHSDGNYQFWHIVHSRIEALFECSGNTRNTSREGYASNIILQTKQILDILETKIESGWSIHGSGIYYNISCEIIKSHDLLSSLSATIELIFDCTDMLRIISNTEYETEKLHSKFDAAWKKNVYEKMCGAFEGE